LMAAALLSYCFFLLFSFHQVFPDGVPVLNLPSGVKSYSGQVKETGNFVNISPQLRVVEGTGPICSYALKESGKDEWGSEVAFYATVTDKNFGTATLHLKPDFVLSCAHATHRLDIAAVHCDSKKMSDSALVEIHVKDINNHSPKFSSGLQTVFVDEGRIYEEILKLSATDADCGYPYGEICRYEITNSGTPFTIVEAGILRNVVPLNYSNAHTYVLSVVAYDCGMRQSEPLLVTVKVNPVCSRGLTQVKGRLHYSPSSGLLPLVADAKLKLCNELCAPDKIWANVKLDSTNVGRGCDRDTYSVEFLKKNCGANERTVELLPSAGKLQFEEGGNDSILANELKFDTGEVYVFDGMHNSISVPYDLIKPTDIPEIFSLSFWMKHERPPKHKGHVKEHIFCMADDRRSNRHHFSVYVKNCKLEMLYRRVHSSNGKNDFEPAEWRWHVPEVCDDRWHYYSFNMRHLKVQLYVDGQSYELKEEPEILDDWPLHASKYSKTRTMIGACWHGQTQTIGQYFKGSLMGMTFLEGQTEKVEVFQCAQKCDEQLQFLDLDLLQPEEQVMFSRDGSELTLVAVGLADYNDLLHRIVYVNSRSRPTPGDRFVTLTTTVKCAANNDTQTMPPTTVEIAVLDREPSSPAVKQSTPLSLNITGQLELSYPSLSVERGVNIFPDLNMKVGHSDRNLQQEPKIQWCRIGAKPPLDKSREDFSSPANLIVALKLDFEHLNDALFLKGLGRVDDYQGILRQIHYFSSRPTEFTSRTFVLECSLMDDNGVSGNSQFMVKVNIEAPRPPPIRGYQREDNEIDEEEVEEEEGIVAATSKSHMPHQMTLQKLEWDPPQPKYEPSPLSVVHLSGYDGYMYSKGTPNKTGVSGMTIIAVVGSCFAIVTLLVAVARLRGSRTRGRKRVAGDDGDLTWDDSGMNITVNPLEDMCNRKSHATDDDENNNSGDSGNDNDGSDQDEHDEDDDGEAEDGEEELSDDEEAILPHVRSGDRIRQTSGLEWDDSTLHDSLVNLNCKHTYRV
ncbi:Calsyntenin-1, partial [Trichinella pseudospiralis]